MVDKHGISVILAAIWEGHTECVKVLLKHVSISTGNLKKNCNLNYYYKTRVL